MSFNPDMMTSEFVTIGGGNPPSQINLDGAPTQVPKLKIPCV
jgi:hypothetical protein